MTRSYRTVLAVAGVAEEPLLSLRELCSLQRVDSRTVVALVREGALEPLSGESSTEWRFPASTAARLALALRLRRELQLGLAGTALALDLLEELERLRNRVTVLEALLEPGRGGRPR